jgi:hypothetical protein
VDRIVGGWARGGEEGPEFIGWAWLAGPKVQLPPFDVVPGPGLPTDASVGTDLGESHPAVQAHTGIVWQPSYQQPPREIRDPRASGTDMAERIAASSSTADGGWSSKVIAVSVTYSA